MTGTSDAPQQTIWTVLGVGVGLQVIGGAVVLAGWPRWDDVASDTCGAIDRDGLPLPCDTESMRVSGHDSVVALGSIIGGIGSLAVLLAIIAFGVYLGMRAAQADSAG
ncbi:hypothetical protein [Pimelobacter simplex]|uniref:hypothetical protein n=1 Tax=Nocardioides simplex TaxID=2045 RepID=UPI003AADAC01